MKNLSFLSLILLFACNQPAKQQVTDNKINPSVYSLAGGNRVVFLTDYYADYLKAVKGGVKNLDSLYRMKIQYPIVNRYFSTCEYAEYAKYQFYMAISDTTGLFAKIAEIDKNRDQIEKLVESTFSDCKKYLKDDSITVYIQPSEGGFMDKVIKRMGGVAAFTPGSKEIMLTIEPAVGTWSNVLAHGLAHEYHHAYWTEMYFSRHEPMDILSDLIFEGRADSYANIIYPGIIAPWDSAINDQQKTDLWNKLKPDLKNTDGTMYSKIMFGSLEDRVNYPIWGGYSLGYAIVQSALKNNPKLTPEEWSAMTPQKILEMSDYK